MLHLENLVMMALAAIILVITIISQVEIKNDCKKAVKTSIRTYDPRSIGRTLHLWLLLVFCVTVFLYGVGNSDTWLILLSAQMSERLTVYRYCRPDDKIARFLAKLNW